MSKVAIVTDSNSGITQAEGKELGISVIPMPFFINGELYLEDINLTQEQFYDMLKKDVPISTSQPNPGDILDLWNKLLKDYDEIVHIPMSSGLSTACATALMLAQDFDDKVQVVDNQRISVTQRQSVFDAMAMADQGMSAAEIRKVLVKEKMEATIYITVDTLKYLKKGGRITPAAAAVGTVLNLKPVLQIQGEKLDAYSKVRGKKQAMKVMMKAIRNDLDTRFAQGMKEGKIILQGAYTGEREEADEFVKTVLHEFPEFKECHMEPLSLSVSCHIGEGALALTATKKAV